LEVPVPDVVGVRFKTCRKIYDFEVDGLEVKRGDMVVVDSDLGLSIGYVIVDRHILEGGIKELKKVLRKVTDEDLRLREQNRALEEEAHAHCLERIMARGLPMKLVCTEVTLDRRRIVFYFTADGRIDFRELVKDLAAKFRTRIEMRQIGVRDEAKIIGGIGICGRELCCRKFLTSFEPISIKMAKSQELVLNANKLSGICGRLMCCLSYEYSEKGEEDIHGTDDMLRIESAEEEVLVDIIEDPPLTGHAEGAGASVPGLEVCTALPVDEARRGTHEVEAKPVLSERGVSGKKKGEGFHRGKKGAGKKNQGTSRKNKRKHHK
jgi:cell fate regulator YaaT (PSP1 superfamily)